MPFTTSSNIAITGPTQSWVQSVQDGSGRMQSRWNATIGTQSKYQISNEPAFSLHIPLIVNPYFIIQYAPPGTAGFNIPWRTHVSISIDGKVKIGPGLATEKLEVDGKVKADDFIWTTPDFPSRLEHVFANRQETIVSRIQKACTTIQTVIQGQKITGSASFISLQSNDLSEGWCFTAAHMVMDTISSQRVLASEVWITNPITNQWISLPNPSTKMFIDGVADVCLIRTGIDFTSFPQYVLSLSPTAPKTGDECWICGNPGGFDNVSISKGVIRDSQFAETSGTQWVNSIFVTAPGIGGNSGSPILNQKGEIIGIYTFGYVNEESFGGGCTWSVLQKTLPILSSLQNNRQKKYLGLRAYVPSVFDLQTLYGRGVVSFPHQGMIVESISTASPFYSILQINDIILSAQVGNTIYDFGDLPSQFPFGVLMYETSTTANEVILTWVRHQTLFSQSIPFTKTYLDVPLSRDMYLNGGI